MRLSELKPEWLKRTADDRFQRVDTIAEADGIIFVCPKCYADNGMQRPGVHSVICWSPRVPQTTSPTPGRWELVGSSFEDLTLVAGSSSVALTNGCKAHFFIRSGEIVDA